MPLDNGDRVQKAHQSDSQPDRKNPAVPSMSSILSTNGFTLVCPAPPPPYGGIGCFIFFCVE